MTLIKSKERAKEHGEIFTPPELVNEMLDQLPPEMWEQSRTFLDPACGNGNILVEVVRRKISLGHCPLQALETTFGIDILQDNVDECKERLLEFTDKSDEAKFYVNKNIKCANSLEIDWKELFSVIISNPPYQDANNKASNNKLWPKFIKKSLEHCEWGVFITPDSWLTSTTSTGESQRKQFTKHHDITYVKNADAIWDKHCPIGVSTGFFVSQRGEYKSKTYVVDYDVKPRYHDLKKPYITLDKQITFNICNKIAAYSDKIKFIEYKENITADEVFDTPQGGSEIHWSGPKIGYVKQDLSKYYHPKYVFPFSCSYKRHFWTDKPIGLFNHYVHCKEENKHIWQDLMSLNVINYFCKHWNKTSGFTPAIKNNMLPNFIGMTNEETYKVLGLTDEEINEIKKHAKK